MKSAKKKQGKLIREKKLRLKKEEEEQRLKEEGTAFYSYVYFLFASFVFNSKTLRYVLSQGNSIQTDKEKNYKTIVVIS